MNEHFIDLTDGTRLAVKVNFGTIYWLEMGDKKGLFKKIKGKKKPSDKDGMEMSALVVYALLRSNGKKVTFDEALELMPPDIEVLQDLMDSFESQLDKYKKKEQGAAYMRNQGKKKH